MAGRGYQIERQVDAIDTNGKPLDVIVGLVRDQHGRLHRGLAIGDGRSALFTICQMTELIRALEQSTADLARVEAGR